MKKKRTIRKKAVSKQDDGNMAHEGIADTGARGITKFDKVKAGILADLKTIRRYERINWHTDARRTQETMFHDALQAIADGVEMPAEIARLALQIDKISP